MDDTDLMDEDLQDSESPAAADSGDVPAIPLPAATPHPQPPATGMNSLEPGWWLPKSAPQVDYGRINAIRDLYNAVPPKQANQAIEMATRLEGVLGYDADVKAGVPTVEALRKWAPKMYFNHPGAVSHLVAPPFQPGATNVNGHDLIQTSPNRYQLLPPPASTETGDLNARPITTPEGKTIGYGLPSKNGVHTKWNTEGAGQPKTSDMIHAYNAQLRGLEKAIESATFSGDKASEAALQKEHSQTLKDLGELTRSIKAPKSGESTIPTVTTQAQYDALPSGSVYLNGKSNRKHRKP